MNKFKQDLEVVLFFLKLGALGFGGPIALVSIMQKECVEKKSWISESEFSQALSLIKAMPGPLATQAAIYIAQHKAGRLVGLLSGIALILPAFFMVILFGVFLKHYSNSQYLQNILLGMQAAAIGVIFVSIKSLAQSHIKKYKFWIFLVLGILCMYLSSSLEPLWIVLGGLLSILLDQFKGVHTKKVSSIGAFLFLQMMVLKALAQVSGCMTFECLGEEPGLFNDKIKNLALICFKAGAFVFGTGLAIVPMLESDFVGRLHWLTHSEFLNALAIGQITPGPVLITTSFIGYKVSGIWGALVATISVFAASFFHMLTWFPKALKWMGRQKWIQDFLVGAMGVVVGSLLLTTSRLALEFKTDYISWLIVALVMTLILVRKMSALQLIFGAGVMSLVLKMIF